MMTLSDHVIVISLAVLCFISSMAAFVMLTSRATERWDNVPRVCIYLLALVGMSQTIPCLHYLHENAALSKSTILMLTSMIGIRVFALAACVYVVADYWIKHPHVVKGEFAVTKTQLMRSVN